MIFFLLKNKNLNIFLKKIKKTYLILFYKKNKIIRYKKKHYFNFINKKNLFKKRTLTFNLINVFLLNFFIFKKYIVKTLFYFKKIFLKKNLVINKILYLYYNNINLYFYKIKIKKIIICLENKFNILKYNIFYIKTKKTFFKKKITQKISINNLEKIFFLLKIKKKIDYNILNNNKKIIFKTIKKYKNKLIFNDLYQECFLELKKIVKNNILNKKKFFKFCYWNVKKIMIRIINSKNKKNNLLLIDKPLFNYSLKYFFSEKERSILIDFARNSLKNIIRELISSLPKKEQKIIRLRFGIGKTKNYTLEEIGFFSCLTKERIRQIELNVLIKIRQPEIMKLLFPYIKIIKSLE